MISAQNQSHGRIIPQLPAQLHQILRGLFSGSLAFLIVDAAFADDATPILRRFADLLGATDRTVVTFDPPLIET